MIKYLYMHGVVVCLCIYTVDTVDTESDTNIFRAVNECAHICLCFPIAFIRVQTSQAQHKAIFVCLSPPSVSGCRFVFVSGSNSGCSVDSAGRFILSAVGQGVVSYVLAKGILTLGRNWKRLSKESSHRSVPQLTTKTLSKGNGYR